ncbi:MAG: hypothetical protein V8S97_05530 [Oscillospiraceae bacterium]
MHNKWNSANVDQLLLRKGDGCVLYSGPEGSVVRNDHLVMSDIADGPALAALLRRLGLENGGLFCVPQGASDEVARAFGLKKGVPCTQWVYGESQPPRVPAGEVRPIRRSTFPCAPPTITRRTTRRHICAAGWRRGSCGACLKMGSWRLSSVCTTRAAWAF